MSKVSKVNARLYARMHLRQVDTLVRLASIENGIGSMLNRTMPQLVDLIANKSITVKSSAFGNIIEAELRNVHTMMKKQFTELAKRSHQSAVDVLDKSLPRRLFELLLPIEPQFEWVKPPQLGKLVASHGELKLVYEEAFDVPAELRKKNLTDAEKHEIRLKVLFPPPSQDEINRILSQGRHISTPGGASFETWEQRFDGLSRLINDKKLAFNEIARGYSEGENITRIRRRLEPVVGGIVAPAQRIARTEGMRVAEQMQRSTWSNLGDMMVGAQIIAVLDERTRPEHATRNGRIYYRNPPLGQPSMADLPDLPDQNNCRCMAIPVMHPPPEFANDPAIRDAFKATASPGTGEPASYSEWFEDAPAAKRKMVTGVARYQAVERALGGTREPKWSDFIDADGKLLPADYLASESAVARTARTAPIDKELETQKKLLLDVQRQGFVAPPGAASPPAPGDRVATRPVPVIGQPEVPAPANRPQIDPSIADRVRNFSKVLGKTADGAKYVPRDMATRLTPEYIKQQIELYNAKTQDVTAIREDFLQRVTPDKQTLKRYEQLKSKWQAGEAAVKKKHPTDNAKRVLELLKLYDTLRSEYGDDLFTAMRNGTPPTSGDERKKLAQAIGGGRREKVRVNVDPSSKQVTQRANEAAEWFNQMIPDDSPIAFEVTVRANADRAYASVEQGSINVSETSRTPTYVHEIAHILEGKVGRTADAAKAVRYAKTQGQAPQHLKTDLGLSFNEEEVSLGKKWDGLDGSQAAYVSKYYYRDQHTEVVSVGLEQLYQRPVQLAKDNPEYFDFLVNVLQGNYAK